MGYHAVFEHCYRLLNETYPGDAQNACEEANGTLAEVKDDVTNGAIYNFTERLDRLHPTVIGVYCKDNCTTELKTFDNSTQAFTAWEKCEPNDLQYVKEKCVVTNFKRGAQWNNVKCYAKSNNRGKLQAACQVKGKFKIKEALFFVSLSVQGKEILSNYLQLSLFLSECAETPS